MTDKKKTPSKRRAMATVDTEAPPAPPKEASEKAEGTAAQSDALPRNERDTVSEAVYLEAKGRGLNNRQAMFIAEGVCDRLRLTGESSDHSAEPNVAFYDLRAEQDHVYPNGKKKVAMTRGRAVVMREPGTVDSIVIHQTACEFGVSKRAIRLAGDIELARARRALDVACHAMAFRNGYYVAAHDLRTYVNHANRLNSNSLGLEIEGRYPGLVDDPTTVPREDLLTTWGGAPSELTEATVEAARSALRWLVLEGRRYGMPIKYVYAHRQSNDNRRSDPGQEIWQRVVLDYGVPKLGLETKPRTLWQQGRSIPSAWDPDGVGDY